MDQRDHEQAHRLFVELQATYRNNDLAGVRALNAAVREGRLFLDRSLTLTETESLGHAIALLRRDLERLALEVRQLRASETYGTLKGMDDWDAYFVARATALQDAIRKLEAELAAYEPSD